MNYEETKYGFTWGPVTIERHIENNGAVLFGLKTAEGEFEVYVTKTGKLRILVPIHSQVTIINTGKKKKYS